QCCEERGRAGGEGTEKQGERRGGGRGPPRRNCKGVHMTNDTNANTTPGARPSAVGQTHRGDEGAPIMGHPFLQGGFAPIQQEYTVTDLPVTGTIPAHLDGRYLRNGPNPAADVDPATYHWLTGDGMGDGVRLRYGRGVGDSNRRGRPPQH